MNDPYPSEDVDTGQGAPDRFTVTGPSTDLGGLDELEPLWYQLHRHHQQVAAYPAIVGDLATSWRLRRAWYESLLDAGGAYFTARTAEPGVVGYLLASVAPGEDDTFAVRGGIVEVVSLVVAEDARGQGIGQQLMRSAEDFARHLGVDTLRVAVMNGNDGAADFYRSLGFQPAEQVLLRRIDRDEL